MSPSFSNACAENLKLSSAPQDSNVLSTVNTEEWLKDQDYRRHMRLGSNYNNNHSPPTVKKSISFFSYDELLNLRALPLTGSAFYLASSVGAVALDETFVK